MVQDAFLSSISALNMVGDIATKNGIQNNTVLIDPTHTLKPSTVEVVEGISVIDSPYYLDIFTAEYFEQSIVGKYVFCSLMYYGGCLPINQKARFKIQDTPELIKDPDVNYKPLLFTTEKTIGDLYKKRLCLPVQHRRRRLPAPARRGNTAQQTQILHAEKSNGSGR